jgi:hypothetical protein
MILARVEKFRIQENFQCASWNWIMYHRNFCKYLRESNDAARMLVDWELTHLPEESYTCSALLQSPYASSKNTAISRYIRFPGGAHPKVFTAENFQEIVTSGACFVRKLNEVVDLQIFDLLDDFRHRNTTL